MEDYRKLCRQLLPINKLGTSPGDIYILNYLDEVIRPANLQEFDKLSYKTEIAPVRYENGLKAFYKLKEWNEDYDKILYKNVQRIYETLNVGN